MADEILRIARDIAIGWKRYVAAFGEVPHGTVPQLAAMLELTPNKTMLTAAPDLLEALKACVNELDGTVTMYRLKRLQYARAAIAKAEGR